MEMSRRLEETWRKVIAPELDSFQAELSNGGYGADITPPGEAHDGSFTIHENLPDDAGRWSPAISFGAREAGIEIVMTYGPISTRRPVESTLQPSELTRAKVCDLVVQLIEGSIGSPPATA